MDEMGLTTISGINERKYGKLLAETLPRVIASDEEFDRMAAQLEALSIPERQLSAEEDALATLLERLIADYDDRFSLPERPPHKMVKYLRAQRGLKQATKRLRPLPGQPLRDRMRLIWLGEERVQGDPRGPRVPPYGGLTRIMCARII
jgi:hypothetical protein